MATLPTIICDDALTPSADLAQPGAEFNDAGRLLEDELWNNAPGGRGQDTGDHSGGRVASGGGVNGGRPVPSFWNFVDNEEYDHEHANNNHHQFELMRHHA